MVENRRIRARAECDRVGVRQNTRNRLRGYCRSRQLQDEHAAYYLRFRVDDRPGIIAKLAGILANKTIGLEAVLQEPCDTKDDLPFVITTEQTSEQSIGEAIEEMSRLDFMREAPLALPMETAL